MIQEEEVVEEAPLVEEEEAMVGGNKSKKNLSMESPHYIREEGEADLLSHLFNAIIVTGMAMP